MKRICIVVVHCAPLSLHLNMVRGDFEVKHEQLHAPPALALAGAKMPESTEADVGHHSRPFGGLGEGLGEDVSELLFGFDSFDLEVGLFDCGVVLLIEIPMEPLR